MLRKASMVEGRIPAMGASPDLFFSPMLAPRANSLATVSWPQNWVAYHVRVFLRDSKMIPKVTRSTTDLKSAPLALDTHAVGCCSSASMLTQTSTDETQLFVTIAALQIYMFSIKVGSVHKLRPFVG